MMLPRIGQDDDNGSIRRNARDPVIIRVTISPSASIRSSPFRIYTLAP